MYRADARYGFTELFVVKTIREKSNIRSRTKAKHEVDTMRDLRHPHVAALLGTFLYLDRLSILIFPAACCDLARYMSSISRELGEIRQENHHIMDIGSMSEGTQTPDSTASRYITGNPAAILSSQGLTSAPDLASHDWPLKLPYLKKLESLRGYFVCLAQALSYIHESNVRHKDIKPENILIDASGSVVVTDFGISKSFPKQVPHVTNEHWDWTLKYASPEIMKGKKVPRDDSSDVFSLGCVFLEIATLVLGKSLRDFSAHYTTPKNETAAGEAYFCNLDNVHTWIDFLQGVSLDESARPKIEQTTGERLTSAQIDSHDFVPESPTTRDPDQRMITALPTIRQMLDETPTARPKTKGLWEKFQWVSNEKCQDCDPRHPDVWVPSAAQKQKAEEGTSNRRSMHQIPEESLPDSAYGRLKFGGIDMTFLSATDAHFNQRPRRSSSPHIHKRSGGVPTSFANGQPVPSRAQRASSPDARWNPNHRSSITTSPRPASPTTSASPLTKTSSNPRAASPHASSRPGNEHRSQSGILNNSTATHQSSYSKRNSVTQIPGSPRGSRHNIKSNSGDLAEKQSTKTPSGGTQEDDRVAPKTDVIIYDYAGEHVYTAPFMAIGGT